MKRTLLIILLLTFTIVASAQDYPFAKDFRIGTVIFKDATQQRGQIKWYPLQNERLKFKVTENGDVSKYSPEDIAGFKTDSLRFVSLFNLEIFSDSYALLGQKTKIKPLLSEKNNEKNV
jgi:hypothetical protein